MWVGVGQFGMVWNGWVRKMKMNVLTTSLKVKWVGVGWLGSEDEDECTHHILEVELYHITTIIVVIVIAIVISTAQP